jgi:capsule polysaccharide export protein KpsE/RkpR
MSSTAAKTSPEVLREVDVDQLLERRLLQDQQEARERRIERAGHLWSRRKILAKFAAWGAAASVLIAVLIPSRFASTTRLMPPDSPQGQGLAMFAAAAGKLGGNLGSIGSELLGLKTSDDLFAGVLLSRTVQDDLITKFDLRKVYGEKRWVDARKELTRQTDIGIDRKSGILTIQVTDHDPKRASAMAQEYVAQLNNVVNELNTSSAHRERVFLEERLSEVKRELESSEKEFSQFASKNGAIDIKEQGKAMVEAAAQLEGQLIAARSELQGLRQIYTDNNVRVRSVRARVNELELQIRKMGGSAGSGENTASPDSTLYPSIRKLPLLGVTYADLFRHTKVEETVFETLTQQYELAKVQEAKEVPSVKVLDPADIPEKKVFPPRTLLVFTGTILALVLGALWIIATDGWNKIDPQDPGKLLVLEVVSSVKPQLAYVTQQRSSLTDRTKKFLDRFDGKASPTETKTVEGNSD